MDTKVVLLGKIKSVIFVIQKLPLFLNSFLNFIIENLQVIKVPSATNMMEIKVHIPVRKGQHQHRTNECYVTHNPQEIVSTSLHAALQIKIDQEQLSIFRKHKLIKHLISGKFCISAANALLKFPSSPCCNKKKGWTNCHLSLLYGLKE